MDQNGRVYWAAQNRPPKEIPAYCKKGSPLRSAQLYPLDVPQEGFFQNSRQVTVYDPKVYTKPFASPVVKHTYLPDAEIGEYFCVPSDNEALNNRIIFPGNGAPVEKK